MLTGLTDFNNLRAKEIEERQNDEDEVEEVSSDQEEIYNDSYCQEFIANIKPASLENRVEGQQVHLKSFTLINCSHITRIYCLKI